MMMMKTNSLPETFGMSANLSDKQVLPSANFYSILMMFKILIKRIIMS